MGTMLPKSKKKLCKCNINIFENIKNIIIFKVIILFCNFFLVLIMISSINSGKQIYISFGNNGICNFKNPLLQYANLFGGNHMNYAVIIRLVLRSCFLKR